MNEIVGNGEEIVDAKISPIETNLQDFTNHISQTIEITRKNGQKEKLKISGAEEKNIEQKVYNREVALVDTEGKVHLLNLGEAVPDLNSLEEMVDLFAQIAAKEGAAGLLRRNEAFGDYLVERSQLKNLSQIGGNDQS